MNDATPVRRRTVRVNEISDARMNDAKTQSQYQPYKDAAWGFINHWYPALFSEELPEQAVEGIQIAGVQILLRRAAGKLYGIGVAAIVEPSVSNMGYISTVLTAEQRAKAGPKNGAIASATVAIDLLGAAELGSFDDTAALIAELDLLITVDTAFAHLAGGLGAPVWLMLPKAADWRWALAPERTPWYPSMRLFRQHRAGDWDEVLARVAAALAAG